MCFLYLLFYCVCVYCRLDLQYLFDWFCSLNVSLLDMLVFTFSGFLLTRPFFLYLLLLQISLLLNTSQSLPTEQTENKRLSANKLATYTSNLQHNCDIRYFISINIKFLLSITAYKNNCKIVSVYHLLCHIRANITATIMIFQSKYVDPFKNWSDTYVQEWTDDNLRWNESEYENVKDIRVPPSTIWAPDILMYNRYNKFWRKLLHSYSISINNPLKFGQSWMNAMSFF